MLNKRFANDQISILKLNDVSLEAKKIIEDKIKQGIYTFEQVRCCICNSDNFEHLADKDRYGLYVPTVICKDCGLVQTNPRMTQKSYEEFYDNEYRKLYGGLESSPKTLFENQYNTLGERIHSFLTNSLKIDLKNELIVEVGCGAGGTLKYFRDQGSEVFGLDLGLKEVEYGRKEHKLDLEYGTIEKLKLLGRIPRIVIYCHVLEHVMNPIEELKKLKQYIGSETFIYIEVPGVKNLTQSYDENFLLYLQNAHLYHFTLNTLSGIAVLAGFKLVKGDESIYSIFIQNSLLSEKKFKNEYPSTIKFLKYLEIARLLPFTPYKIKKRLKKLNRNLCIIKKYLK
jgi:SAM-dependent methyltransferase